MGVADQNGLRSGVRCGSEELAQIVGADHAGFVDDDHGLTVQCQGAVFE
jgi:hypothetical protein